MDYKKELGHCVWPRAAFLKRLQKCRGPFRIGEADELSIGTSVEIHGLNSRPDLNGLSGVVASALVDGRYAVEAGAGQGVFRLLPANLKSPGAHVGATAELHMALKLSDGEEHHHTILAKLER